MLLCISICLTALVIFWLICFPLWTYFLPWDPEGDILLQLWPPLRNNSSPQPAGNDLTNTAVLALPAMDVIPFITSPIVLFWFSRQDGVNIPVLLSSAFTVSRPFLPALPPQRQGWRCTKSWERTQLTPIEQRDISHHMTLCLAVKNQKKKVEVGPGHLWSWCLSSQPTIICAEALLSWKWLNICLRWDVMNSFIILLCLHKSRFSHFSPSDSLPHPLAEESVWTRGGTYLSTEVKPPQQLSVYLAFTTTRVQSQLMLIGSRHTPRSFPAALFPAHQSQHWCKRFFLSGWTSRLPLLNFQRLCCLISTSLLATLTGNTSL